MSTQKYSRYVCGERIGGQECTSEMHNSQRPTASREHTSMQYHIFAPVYNSTVTPPAVDHFLKTRPTTQGNKPSRISEVIQIQETPSQILGHSCRASASCFAERRGMTPLLKREILWEPEQKCPSAMPNCRLWMMMRHSLRVMLGDRGSSKGRCDRV